MLSPIRLVPGRGHVAASAFRQLQNRSVTLSLQQCRPVLSTGCVHELYKSYERGICSTVPVYTTNKTGHGHDANWERTQNRDKAYFTPGPLDPEVIDPHIPDHAKKLFTPGPLGVTKTTKAAMMLDIGPFDAEFIKCLSFIRSEMIKIADLSDKDYTTILLQGSGTYAMEGVLQTNVPRNNPKVLVIENGIYGKRMSQICQIAGFPLKVLNFPENERIDLAEVERYLQNNPDVTTVGMVHHETSSGILNPVEYVGKLVQKYTPGASFYVDAMSSFGAIPLDLEDAGIDFLTVSANKCIEGVPGFSFILANKRRLMECEGNSRSLSFDLVSQYIKMEKEGTFRFTPATHTLLAFGQALKEFQEEGGVEGRGRRYKKNNKVLREGMKKMGFKEFLPEGLGSFLITTYTYPKHPNFNSEAFFKKLNDKDQMIGPGAFTACPTFRIFNIGQIFPHDVRHLLKSVETVCHEMELNLPLRE
ncbi:2-aminoethylphosphonate--pyruvate transaminase-like isoform X2 [Lineus longissimus]|uniref:2-aminoethylphosphonate--pyruvate transaminase-like isoform X2 n=1 Tax=Lineus longissimus TaxID=88925 RepID=UPI002B4D48F7